MNRKLERAIREQKRQTAPDVPEISGLLGIPIDGAKTVEVPNRNGFVYVRLRNNQNEVIQAFNNQVAPAYGLPVKVIRQGNKYSVLGVDEERYANNWTSFAPFLPRHGNTHSFDIESGGGADIVWVYPRQFMPALILPSGSVGAPNVIMSPYMLKNDNGTWRYTGNTGTASFTPYNPSISTGAIMGLIYLDSDSGNPGILINSGSVFSSSLTGSSQIYPYIPTITSPGTQIPLAAIRLVSGTSRLTWDNIYDVRQFVHNQPTGSSGGLSSVAVQDEGVSQGNATTFNFIGSPVIVSVSGSVATVSVSATASGSSGSPAFTGTPNSAVLTDSSGTLFTPTWLKWTQDGGQKYLDFGADEDKVSPAGIIGYNKSQEQYEIFGGGTGTPRKVKIFEDLYVDNNLYVGGGQQIFADRQVTNGDSHDHLGGDGGTVNHTSLLSIGTNTHAQIDTHIASGTSSHYYSTTIGTFLGGGTIPATGTYHSCPFKSTADTIAHNYPWPEGGKLSELALRIGTSQPASGSLVATLFVNGIASALVVNVPAGSAAGTYSDSINTVTIVPEDLLRWTLVNNATSASALLTGINMKLTKRVT